MADPGIATAVPGRVELTLDLRHVDADRLAGLRDAALGHVARVAAHRGCSLTAAPLWSVAPTRFDDGIVARAGRACAAAGGSAEPVVSGPGHDAVEMAKAVPTAMVFAPSIAGLSHTRDEDTGEAELRVAVAAFADLACDVVDGPR